eukprot:3154137-Lingulodinium_polyedra.AAC.1
MRRKGGLQRVIWHFLVLSDLRGAMGPRPGLQQGHYDPWKRPQMSRGWTRTGWSRPCTRQVARRSPTTS